MARWRSLDQRLADLPLDEPWPSRTEAFRVACAVHAGQRERDLMELMEGLAGSGN